MTATVRLIAAPLVLACAAALVGCADRSRSIVDSNNNQPALALSTAAESAAAEPTKTSEAVARAPELLVTRTTWQFNDATGSMIVTPNYRLYTTVPTDSFLERLPVFYERALEHYTTALAELPAPTRRLETFLFHTRRQWQAKTQEMLPEQADMFANLGRGGFTTRGTSVLYYIDRYGYPRDTFAIAAHEGWHQYTQQTFKHQLPIWLEEGIATYMEGYRRDGDQLPEFNAAMNYERAQTLRSAARNDEFIALDDLLTRSPQSFLDQSKDSLLVYYAQAWALTRYLAEGESGRYRESLRTVLLDAAEGRLVGRMASSPHLGNRRRGVNFGARVGAAVVQEYFNADLLEFEAGYFAFVHDLLQQMRSPGREPRASAGERAGG